MTSLAIHMLQGDALRMEEFFKHASCHPTTQFEDFNHVNADATDKTKIVTTKFVLGFCHGQIRFCLLVRIGPNPPGICNHFLWIHQSLSLLSQPQFINPRGISATCKMKSRLTIKFPSPYEWWSNAVPPGQEMVSNAQGMLGGGGVEASIWLVHYSNECKHAKKLTFRLVIIMFFSPQERKGLAWFWLAKKECSFNITQVQI